MEDREALEKQKTSLVSSNQSLEAALASAKIAEQELLAKLAAAEHASAAAQVSFTTVTVGDLSCGPIEKYIMFLLPQRARGGLAQPRVERRRRER